MLFLFNVLVFFFLIQKKLIFSIKLESCTDQQYFNSVSLTCETCTEGNNNKELNNNQCVCTSNSRLTSNGCELCVNQCSNSYRTQCLDVNPNPPENCKPVNGFLTEKTILGENNKLFVFDCGNDSTYDPTSNDCICTDTTKTYYNGACVDTPPYSTTDEPFFRRWMDNNETRITESNTQITSTFFRAIYPKARLGCNDGDSQSCQVLANLCVLKMYDETTLPCKEMIQGDPADPKYPGRPTNFPWLYYPETLNVEEYLMNETKVNFNVSLDRENKVFVNELEFYVAKWDMYGNYYGLNKLKGELILCSSTYNDTIDFLTFGATIVKKCTIDIQKFQGRDYTMFFYELFLKHPSSTDMIDIPIVISNIKYNTFDNGQEDKKNWRLVRRFFIVDNLSSVTNYPIGNATNAFFAKYIKLDIKIQNKKRESLIYLPYLRIDYYGKGISNTDPLANRVVVKFTSQYWMDLGNFMRGAKWTFAVVTALAGIVVICRMYVWTKLNPSVLSPDNYYLWFLYTTFFKILKYWGLFMFFFSWGISIYWYLFFKVQYRAFILLPEIEQYKPYYKKFNIFWGLGATSFCLYMFYRIGQQTNFDIFFVDWEHDKDILVNNMNDIRSEKYRGAWRGLHVANQFNQLQKQRTISIQFCFCWLIMLWYYQEIHWKTYSTSVPNIAYVESSPDNYVLRFCIATFVLFIAGITQYIVVRLLQLWLPLKKIEFLDLCSVSNISVFILDQSLHGYYIHGQSPLGKSDTNLDELLKFLEEEGKGKIRGRGVTDDQSDDLQSYEIFLSYNMRTVYDGLYYIQTRAIIEQADDTDKLHNQSRLPNIFKYIPNSLNIQSVYLLNSYMNTQLKNKIEGIASQSKIFIREKTNCERFLDFPPSIDLISPDAKEMVFYKDPNANFDDVLFSGMELEWLIMTIYWFQMWLISLEKYGNSLPISIFLTFICETILYKARVFFGEKNVAKKAVIDNRFFS